MVKVFSLLTDFYFSFLCMALLGSPVTGEDEVEGLTLLLLQVGEQAVLSLSPNLVPVAAEVKQ